MKMYEITEDLRAIDELFNSAVDENGQPRELTDEEKQFLTECFSNSKEDFEEKFDSYGKYLAILKAQAEAADGERKAMKNEMDRLSARAKAYTNRRDSIKSYLFFNMQNLGIEKYKTSLFSANVQLSPISVSCIGNVDKLPEDFLKPREADTTAIKKAIKDGEIVVTDSGDLYYDGEKMEGLKAEKNKILVIR